MDTYFSAAALIQASYLLTAFCYHGTEAHELAGHRAQRHRVAGAGMLVATLATFFYPGLTNFR